MKLTLREPSVIDKLSLRKIGQWPVPEGTRKYELSLEFGIYKPSKDPDEPYPPDWEKMQELLDYLYSKIKEFEAFDSKSQQIYNVPGRETMYFVTNFREREDCIAAFRFLKGYFSKRPEIKITLNWYSFRITWVRTDDNFDYWSQDVEELYFPEIDEEF